MLSKGSESECDNDRTAQIMGRSESGGVVCEVIIDATALEKEKKKKPLTL